jgi:hypothetical protein
MKKILLVLFLTLSFQTLTKADDIRELEIEGMSIGDSLLDFYSEKEIKQSYVGNYTSDKYKTAQFLNSGNFIKYDAVHINFLKTDKKMIIQGIQGIKEYNQIKKCIKDKKNITSDIESLFTDIKIDELKQKHVQDKSGKSLTYDIYIETQSKDYISISCYDWASNMGFQDHLRIAIVTNKFMDWINNEAYK